MTIIKANDRVQCDYCNGISDVDSVFKWLKVSIYEAINTQNMGEDYSDKHFCSLDCLKHYYMEDQEEVKEIEVKYTMNKDGELSNFSNITVDGNLFRPVEKHQDYHGGKNVYVTEKWRRGGGK